MADLQALVYVSSAKRLLSADELTHLLECARERNAKEKVTGVLLYSHGKFMQYLEGPAAGLNTVYEVIKADAKHEGIIELVREAIPSREFADWSMAFRDIRAYGMASPPGIDDALSAARPLGEPADSAARILLTKFWNKGGVRIGF